MIRIEHKGWFYEYHEGADTWIQIHPKNALPPGIVFNRETIKVLNQVKIGRAHV